MAGWKVASLIGYVTLVIVIMVVNVQGSVSDDVAAIEAQADRLEESFRAGDLETFVNTYTEDCRLFFPDFPELRGKAALNASVAAVMRNGVSSIEVYTTEIIQMGEYYYRSGVNTLYFSNGTVSNVLNFVTIFRKEQGEWLYLVDAVNRQRAP